MQLKNLQQVLFLPCPCDYSGSAPTDMCCSGPLSMRNLCQLTKCSTVGRLRAQTVRCSSPPMSVLSTSLYVIHSVHFTLCTSLYAIHTMHHSMNFTPCTLHSMHSTLCTSLYALHSMHFTPCTSLYVVGSEGSARKNPSTRPMKPSNLVVQAFASNLAPRPSQHHPSQALHFMRSMMGVNHLRKFPNKSHCESSCLRTC